MPRTYGPDKRVEFLVKTCRILEKKYFEKIGVLSKYMFGLENFLKESIEEAEKKGLRIGWQEIDALLAEVNRHNPCLDEVDRGMFFSINPFYPYPRTPRWLVEFLKDYLSPHKTSIAYDPWASTDALMSALIERRCITGGVAYPGNKRFTSIGHGQNINILSKTALNPGNFDVVISFPILNDSGYQKEPLYSPLLKRKIIVEGQENLMRILKACLGLKTGNEAILLVTDDFFDSRKNGISESLPRFGFNIQAILHTPPAEILPYPTIPIRMVFIRKAPRTSFLTGKLTDDIQRNKAIARLLKSSETQLGLLHRVKSSLLDIYVLLESKYRAEKIAAQAGLKGKALKDITFHIRSTDKNNPMGFQDNPYSLYLPLKTSELAFYALHGTNLKPEEYIQLGVKPQEVNARYLEVFFNSSLGRIVRKTAGVEETTKEKIERMKVYLPPIKIQTQAVNFLEKLDTSTIDGRETKARLLMAPHDIEKFQKIYTKIGKTDKGFVYWINSLPLPLATSLQDYYQNRNDSKKRCRLLLDFFNELTQFMATVLMSGCYHDKKRFRRLREILWRCYNKYGISISEPPSSAWSMISMSLAQDLRDAIKSEPIWASKLLSTDDEGVLNSLGSEEIVGILCKTNQHNYDWFKVDKSPPAKEEQRRHLILGNYLNTIRETISVTWERYCLVKAVGSKISKGIYKNKIILLTGPKPPFETIEVEMEHKMLKNELYLWTKTEMRALPVVPLLKVAPDNETAYFYERKNKDGSMSFSSPHLVKNAVLKDKYADAASLINLLSQPGFDEP